MVDTFDTCLAFTLREEGGYVDNPADPGRGHAVVAPTLIAAEGFGRLAP